MDRGCVKRILVIRTDFLGDMVCTTPLLYALKKRWPQAEIHVLCSKYNAEVLDNNPCVTRIHYYVYSKNRERNGRAGFLNYLTDRARLIFSLRRIRFDLLIIPSGGMNKNAIRFARQLNVADCRWHTAETEFDDRVREHVLTRPLIHEALAGFALVPELEMPAIHQIALQVFPCQARIVRWQRVLGEKKRARVGLFITNHCKERQWPIAKWLQLIGALSRSVEVVIFRALHDTEIPEECRKENTREIATGNVADLVAAMALMDIIVSADSAPVHLASALNIPVVALFESRREKYCRWYPLGTRYILLHEGESVSDIASESVINAARILLNEVNISSANKVLPKSPLTEPPVAERHAVKKVLALKYCQTCGAQRGFLERLFATEPALCDDCYDQLIRTVRERHE